MSEKKRPSLIIVKTRSISEFSETSEKLQKSFRKASEKLQNSFRKVSENSETFLKLF
jgi:hypothetical protein